jgi:probable rRNA maturation factor
MAINFNFEDIPKLNFPKNTIKNWIKSVIQSNNFKIGSISYIFCADDYILQVNKEYLNHDYFTDIISFNYNENKTISGDLFISVDTVKTNAQEYGVTFDKELYRVMIHGVLHLLGFDDITDELQQEMTQKEDEALNILYTNFL